MKSIAITSLVYLFFGSNLTCKDFYSGSFELDSVDKTTHKIIRTEKKQIEILESKGTEVEFDIQWLDDCKYMLFNRHVIKGVDNDPLNKDTLYSQISDLDENSCKVTSWFKWSSKSECKMVKVK
jgi:hypothetical protein